MLTVSHGTITVGTPGGIVTGNDSGSVTLTGTAAAIDAALATASYTGNLNYFGFRQSGGPPPPTAPAAARPRRTRTITIANTTGVSGGGARRR